MFIRTITLCIGLAGGLCAAQLPAFTQQYAQRLGGAVDALSEVVADFDRSAAAAGLTREAALVGMTGSTFLERRQADVRRSVARLERLRADLDALQGAGPFSRAYYTMQRADPEISRRALAAFRPGLPIGPAGLIFGAAGFLATLAGLRLIAFLLPRRRTRAA